MTNSHSKNKIMRKVGEVWLDPEDVSAAEEVTLTQARFHLRNGSVIDTEIPTGKTLAWMMGRLSGEGGSWLLT